MEVILKDVLQNIVKIRKIKGLSQDYVSQKLGVSQGGYLLIEKGERRLTVDFLLQIAIVLEVDVIDFFINENHQITGRSQIVDDKSKLIASLEMNIKLLTEKLKQYENA